MDNTLLITDERIGTVSPLLHSHFAEHLGELFYPGLWAGHGHPLAVTPEPARQIETRDGAWQLTLPPGAVVRLQG